MYTEEKDEIDATMTQNQIIIKNIKNFKKNKNKTHNIAQLCTNVENQLKDELKQVNLG